MGIRNSYSPFNKNHCSFCSSPHWSGCWVGPELVLVCRPCAIRILPALIADATWSTSWTPELGMNDWLQIETAFWHALKLNAHRTPRAKKYNFTGTPPALPSMFSSKGGRNV